MISLKITTSVTKQEQSEEKEKKQNLNSKHSTDTSKNLTSQHHSYNQVGKTTHPFTTQPFLVLFTY